jgi:hypothetical protein
VENLAKLTKLTVGAFQQSTHAPFLIPWLPAPGKIDRSPMVDKMVGSVPDRRRRILKVVLVRRLVTWVLEFGGGRVGERVEKGEVSLQAT